MTHNKYTNVILMHTSLMHKIAEALIREGNKTVIREASIAKSIIKNHFKPGSPLYTYLEVANAVLKSNMINENKDTAVLFLKEIEQYILEQNWKDYEKAKISFLKEVKKLFRLETLVYNKFPNYRTSASTHLFIESCMGVKNISKISDKVKICSTLVEQLINKKPISKNNLEISNYIKENNISKSTVLIAVNQLKSKVSSLKEAHKEIVSLFLVETDTDQIARELHKKTKNYLTELKELQRDTQDFETQKQLSEIISNLKSVQISSKREELEELAEKLIDIDDLIEIFKKGE